MAWVQVPSWDRKNASHDEEPPPMFFFPKPRARLATCMAIGFWALSLVCPAAGRAQVSPEESARKIKPADGLEAKLWAAEPMVHNPTNMDIDSRGRVWITEGLNYRLTKPRNNALGKVDEADRIKILEDTDGDGKADKVTVFADRIYPVPMGLAVEEHYSPSGKYQGCRVFIGNSPDLLVLEDTDGDDRADTRYPLLTGFGGVDSDHGVHGMVLGLDGKLYFTHGDGCCSVQQDHSERTQNFDVVDASGRHVSSDQLANTLRVNRDGTQFEILADRQRNNYETSLNAFGNVFTSDNDDDGNRGCRVIWVLDGGHYGYRTPGSPRHWGEEVPGNVPKLVGTGNGSPCGLTVYEGRLLPAEYRGAVLEAEAGTRQINYFPIERHGASFRTEYKVFLASDDPWFRPVDVTTAPDGSVFVADWYDAGVGGHAFRDQTTGRIYHVTPKGAHPGPARADFATLPGLIAALKSPVIATQDAARQGLIERAKGQKQAVVTELVRTFSEAEPLARARALWVLQATVGDAAAVDALKDRDPRIREQAVRMLGRDVRENGHVEYKDPAARRPPPAAAHLPSLLPMAADPDAGVRRELILALRNVPTAEAGAALQTLARTWDGRDRWYLEALGLALDNREETFLAELFDGTLYGDLELDKAGAATQVALPPYFPVDRNEAFIPIGAADPPVSALSKTLGLAWRIHQPVVLPLLARLLPKLESPEMQDGLDDVLTQIRDPKAAVIVAGMISQADDPARQRQLLATLARKLGSDWRAARADPQVITATERALNDPELKLQGIEMAAATGDVRYAGRLQESAQDKTTAMELRVAAIEALSRLKPAQIRAFLNDLIAADKGKRQSSPLAEAAVRALPRVENASQRLAELITAPDYPPGLRRAALRTFAQGNGGHRVLEMARAGTLPEDLKTEATTVLNGHPNRDIRNMAAQVLPLPRTATGRPLPPLNELLVRPGQADHGRAVFFRTGTNGCGSCHRVQGQGQWIGPDLSTIGTKYGKDELLRSILNPSEAVGYSFRAQVVALNDGRVLTGLAVEDGPDRLVLKTAEGQRITIRPGDIEDRKTSDLSLMPEGLAQTMSDQDLVDLLAFLSVLRQSVSIVGQYHVIGPVAESNGTLALDPQHAVDLTLNLRGPEGQKLSWRRLDANAESLADLTALAGSAPTRGVYLYAPVISPIQQDARIVLDTKADINVWLGGKSLSVSRPSDDGPTARVVTLPRGSSDLLIRVGGGPGATLVTTFVSSRPLTFRGDETAARPQ
jgi:putative membrane-bound dehydrogenase-like protein